MKQNKKGNKMFLLAMLAATLAFGLVLAGCKDGSDDSSGGGGKTVTFTLAKVGTGFTVTVDGADWDNTTDFFNFMRIFDGSELTGTNSDPLHEVFDFSSLSGKVVTVTLNSGYTVAGTLKFSSFLNYQFYGSSVTDGGYGIDEEYMGSTKGTTTYVGKPAEGITFP